MGARTGLRKRRRKTRLPLSLLGDLSGGLARRGPPQACLLRLPPGRPCARGRAVRWRLEHLLSLQWVESDLLCEYPLLCGAMTTQFCTSSTSTLHAISYPVSSSPSSSWRRRARRLRLAMFRQALFDIHTLQCVPVGMQSPEVVQSPAVGQSPEIRVPEALGVMTESFDGVAKPDGPTDRGKAFSSYSVACSPDAVQFPDGVLVSVSFLPGVHNEELQDEELQNEDLQSEEVLNEQLHYSQHTFSFDFSSEVCHASSPDAPSDCLGKAGQEYLQVWKEVEESPDVVQPRDVLQSSEGVLQSILVSVSIDPAVLNEDWQDNLKKVMGDEVEHVQPDSAVDWSSSVTNNNSKNSEVVSVSVDPGVLKEELHDEELQGEELQNEELRNEQLHCSHYKDSMISHPGSSTTGSLSNAVVSSAVTEDECQAARDWALAGVDVSALWRELHRLPRQEFQRRTEALHAYRLQLGIESSEEDDSQQGGPQSSTSRSALTRSGKKHRKRHR
ncbi:unnamed protein product [Prorocentrum cordatum]|uniref:Uncharacterized protein n=1 Tax=Prorocentrum cordatum TaxID=2364126 RepID=A0ABN9V0Q4_9DINO|nr:unnamed protein product [Polarella glacialis]